MVFYHYNTTLRLHWATLVCCNNKNGQDFHRYLHYKCKGWVASSHSQVTYVRSPTRPSPSLEWLTLELKWQWPSWTWPTLLTSPIELSPLFKKINTPKNFGWAILVEILITVASNAKNKTKQNSSATFQTCSKHTLPLRLQLQTWNFTLNVHKRLTDQIKCPHKLQP